MSTTTTIAELPSFKGQELGTSDWIEVTQERVNLFADATGDHQWIHIDVERAKAESPFGGPIAHGYLTLSLMVPLVSQTYTISDAKMGVNYGLNKVRFPAPVPVGSKVRARVTLKDVEEVAGGLQNTFADATGDHQWIHIDVERAKAESPFGGPIAHGYLTLSLIPSLVPQIIEISGFRMGVNYGTEKVRFPSPVPVGARVRAGVTMESATPFNGGIAMNLAVTMEIEGGTKPAMVATVVYRRYL